MVIEIPKISPLSDNPPFSPLQPLPPSLPVEESGLFNWILWKRISFLNSTPPSSPKPEIQQANMSVAGLLFVAIEATRRGVSFILREVMPLVRGANNHRIETGGEIAFDLDIRGRGDGPQDFSVEARTLPPDFQLVESRPVILDASNPQHAEVIENSGGLRRAGNQILETTLEGRGEMAGCRITLYQGVDRHSHQLEPLLVHVEGTHPQSGRTWAQELSRREVHVRPTSDGIALVVSEGENHARFNWETGITEEGNFKPVQDLLPERGEQARIVETPEGRQVVLMREGNGVMEWGTPRPVTTVPLVDGGVSFNYGGRHYELTTNQGIESPNPIRVVDANTFLLWDSRHQSCVAVRLTPHGAQIVPADGYAYGYTFPTLETAKTSHPLEGTLMSDKAVILDNRWPGREVAIALEVTVDTTPDGRKGTLNEATLEKAEVKIGGEKPSDLKLELVPKGEPRALVVEATVGGIPFRRIYTIDFVTRGGVLDVAIKSVIEAPTYKPPVVTSPQPPPPPPPPPPSPPTNTTTTSSSSSTEVRSRYKTLPPPRTPRKSLVDILRGAIREVTVDEILGSKHWEGQRAFFAGITRNAPPVPAFLQRINQRWITPRGPTGGFDIMYFGPEMGWDLVYTHESLAKNLHLPDHKVGKGMDVCEYHHEQVGPFKVYKLSRQLREKGGNPTPPAIDTRDGTVFCTLQLEKNQRYTPEVLEAVKAANFEFSPTTATVKPRVEKPSTSKPHPFKPPKPHRRGPRFSFSILSPDFLFPKSGGLKYAGAPGVMTDAVAIDWNAIKGPLKKHGPGFVIPMAAGMVFEMGILQPIEQVSGYQFSEKFHETSGLGVLAETGHQVGRFMTQNQLLRKLTIGTMSHADYTNQLEKTGRSFSYKSFMRGLPAFDIASSAGHQLATHLGLQEGSSALAVTDFVCTTGFGLAAGQSFEKMVASRKLTREFNALGFGWMMTKLLADKEASLQSKVVETALWSGFYYGVERANPYLALGSGVALIAMHAKDFTFSLPDT